MGSGLRRGGRPRATRRDRLPEARSGDRRPDPSTGSGQTEPVKLATDIAAFIARLYTQLHQPNRWRQAVSESTTKPETTTTRDPQLLALAAALSAPFDPKNMKFKPQMVKNNRALAMAYIDARLIQDRLDEVLGVENWQDKYDILPDGSVMCRLKINITGRWITKTDVGSPSEQPDSGDRLKAAFSDALKRAAVKFGIGRYLYRLKAEWVDYDPVKKQLIQVPQLPPFALPAKAKTAKPEPKSEPKPDVVVEAKPVANEELTKTETKPTHALPSSGQELHRRLQDYDAK